MQPQRRFRSIGIRLWVTIATLIVVVFGLAALSVVKLAIPSLSLKVIGAGVQHASVPAVPALTELQAERQQALAYLAVPGADVVPLIRQENQASTRLRDWQAAAASTLSGAPPQITDRLTEFVGLLAQLQQQRDAIASRSTTLEQAFAYYNQVLDAATSLFDAQSRIVPDAGISQSAIAATDLFRATDEMSRAGSLAAGALANGSFARGDYLLFQRLVGAYHTDMEANAQYLEPAARAQYGSIVHGQEYLQLSSVEEILVARGPDPQKPAVQFPISPEAWSALTSAVSKQFAGLTISQATIIATKAADTGDDQWAETAWTLSPLLAAAIAAAAYAVWFGLWLIKRLSRQVRWVRRVSTVVVPDLVSRIREETDFDIAGCVELPDDRPDEIGALAAAHRDATIANIEASKREILQQEGATLVLTALARRVLVPIDRQLEILDEAEQEQRDMNALGVYFRLEHQARRARRSAHNMIVVGGGSPREGRRDPVPLHSVLEGAGTEIADPVSPDPQRVLERFVFERIPERSVMANVAHRLAHLVAELLDNAVRYSPPGSEIRISGMRTHHGVAVEIADAGPGLVEEQLEQANELMVNPPMFDVMVGADAVNHLGLFAVARYGRLLGVKVGFKTNAFQGLSAIVAIPEDILIQAETNDQSEPDFITGGSSSDTPAYTSWFGPPARFPDTANAEPSPHQVSSTRVTPLAMTPSSPRHARGAAPAAEASLTALPARKPGEALRKVAQGPGARETSRAAPAELDPEATAIHLGQLQRAVRVADPRQTCPSDNES